MQLRCIRDPTLKFYAALPTDLLCLIYRQHHCCTQLRLTPGLLALTTDPPRGWEAHPRNEPTRVLLKTPRPRRGRRHAARAPRPPGGSGAPDGHNLRTTAVARTTSRTGGTPPQLRHHLHQLLVIAGGCWIWCCMVAWRMAVLAACACLPCQCCRCWGVRVLPPHQHACHRRRAHLRPRRAGGGSLCLAHAPH
jgi:hypothetical protein